MMAITCELKIKNKLKNISDLCHDIKRMELLQFARKIMHTMFCIHQEHIYA